MKNGRAFEGDGLNQQYSVYKLLSDLDDSYKNLFLELRKDISDSLHNDRFGLLDTIYAIKSGLITIEKCKIPDLPPIHHEEKDYWGRLAMHFHHDINLSTLAARLLLIKFSYLPIHKDFSHTQQDGFYLGGKMCYPAGECDVSLIEKIGDNYFCRVAVEIGATKPDKPIEAFRIPGGDISGTWELWIVSNEKQYYCFKPTKKVSDFSIELPSETNLKNSYDETMKALKDYERETGTG